jgi:hypothetical protein
MRTALTTIAKAAGADVVIYDREPLQNVLLDEAKITDTICLITEIRGVTITTSDNGLDDSFQVQVAFVKQVNLENFAENNDALMNALLLICKAFITGLVKANRYQRNISVNCLKYEERESDFNAIGWKMNLTLNPIYGYAEC